jgi:hypothetical protein
MRAEVRDIVAQNFQGNPDLVFVLKPSVVRADGDFHVMYFAGLSLPRRIELRQSPAHDRAGRPLNSQARRLHHTLPLGADHGAQFAICIFQ